MFPKHHKDRSSDFYWNQVFDLKPAMFPSRTFLDVSMESENPPQQVPGLCGSACWRHQFCSPWWGCLPPSSTKWLLEDELVVTQDWLRYIPHFKCIFLGYKSVVYVLRAKFIHFTPRWKQTCSHDGVWLVVINTSSIWGLTKPWTDGYWVPEYLFLQECFTFTFYSVRSTESTEGWT